MSSNSGPGLQSSLWSWQFLRSCHRLCFIPQSWTFQTGLLLRPSRRAQTIAAGSECAASSPSQTADIQPWLRVQGRNKRHLLRPRHHQCHLAKKHFLRMTVNWPCVKLPEMYRGSPTSTWRLDYKFAIFGIINAGRCTQRQTGTSAQHLANEFARSRCPRIARISVHGRDALLRCR